MRLLHTNDVSQNPEGEEAGDNCQKGKLVATYPVITHPEDHGDEDSHCGNDDSVYLFKVDHTIP